jgi:glycosyltransferase involved in cell wall biosynthesis
MLRVPAGQRAFMEQRSEEFAAMLRLPNAVVAPAQFLADSHREWSGAQPIVVRHGIDSDALMQVPARVGGGPTRLAFFGRISPEKGLHVALQAVRGLRPTELQFDVFGEWPAGGRYREQLDALVDSRLVNIRGPYGKGELAALMGSADCVVVPSVCLETGPLVVLEALAAGRKVIASDSGGPKEIIQSPRQGWTFATNDAADLRRRIADVIANPGTLDGADRSVRSTSDYAGDITDLYRRVLASARS